MVRAAPALAICAALVALAWPVQALAQGSSGPSTTIASAPAGPLERQSQPITPENPIPRRLSAVMPAYPPDLREWKGTTRVDLLVTLDATGRVAETRAIRAVPGNSGIPAAVSEGLERAAMEAVRRWQYDPPARAPITLALSFSFSRDAETTLIRHGAELQGGTPTGFTIPTYSNPEWAAARERVPPRKVRDRLPQFPRGVSMPKGASALVLLQVTLGADGKIESMQVLQGTPPFDKAALEAVREWQFTPALADGKPVPFTMPVTVSFHSNR